MRARYGYARRSSEYREHWYTFIDWAVVAMVTGSVMALLSIAFAIWSRFRG